MGVISIFWEGFEVENMSDLQLGLMAIPFGVLTALGVYTLLNRIWKKNQKEAAVSIDDIGKD
ncbi:MAG: hypothetical protein R2781_04260 [Flavobacteriaceae bacterium]